MDTWPQKGNTVVCVYGQSHAYIEGVVCICTCTSRSCQPEKDMKKYDISVQLLFIMAMLALKHLLE